MVSQQVARGRALKAARIQSGLGQKEASEKLGIHRVSLSRIETGKQKKVSADLYQKMITLYSDLTAARGITSATGLIDLEMSPADALDAFRRNPEFRRRLPPKPYARVYEHIDRMVAAGCSAEQTDEAERLMIDAAYNKINTRDVRDRSDDEMIVDIDDAWDWIKEVLGRAGIKGLADTKPTSG
jgi:transcriptional regulator with XRE-family HTH domain